MNLPVTDAGSSLLVSSYDWRAADETDTFRGLLLLDLARNETVGIPNVAEYTSPGFSDNGDAWWVSGDRSLGVRDSATGDRREVELPDDIEGTVNLVDGLTTLGGLLSVTVETGAHGERTVLIDHRGALRCIAPEGSPYRTQVGGLLLSYDGLSVLDPSSCDITPTSELLHRPHTDLVAVRGKDAYAAVARVDERVEPISVTNTIHRVDVSTGEQRAESAPLPGVLSQAEAQGDAVWVLTESQIARLDADTLAMVATADLPADVIDCNGMPYLVGQADDMYLLDDCSAVLYRLDPRTAAPAEGWTLPHDEGSDIQINSTPNRDGIWMVDDEQTVVPFLFDTVEQRFERLPFDTSITSSIFAMQFAVFPGPDR